MKYLGIDWGEKRIGLAIADNSAKLAVPYGVVFSIQEVIKVINEESADIILVGKPISMSGSETLSSAYNNFINGLKNNLKIEVELVDERLSSKAADSLMGSKKEKAPRDAIAAMIILQSYLDAKYSQKTD